MDNNELMHHGILGMKWGIRRYQNKDGSLTPAGKKRAKSETSPHEDYTKAHSKKSVKNMSDAELRNRVNRYQMEQQYNRFSENKVTKGREYVNKAIKAGATVASVTTTAITIYNNYKKLKNIING